MGLNPRSTRPPVLVAAVAAFVRSALKWFLVLNVGIAWLFFWGNLARLHLSMGDLLAAVLTVVLIIGPVVVAFSWWVVRRSNRGPAADRAP